MSSKTRNNPDNPFAALDAARFPTAEDKKKADSKPHPRSNQKKSDPHPDEGSGADSPDAMLFMQAMGAVNPLVKGAGRKQPTGEDGGAPCLDEIWRFKEEFGKKKHSGNKRSGDASKEKNKDAAAGIPKKESRTDNGTLADSPDSSEDDGNEFFHAMADVAPLAGKGREVPPEPAPVTPPPAVESNPLQDIVEGKVEFALHATEEYVEGHVVGLDLLTVGKLQARQYSPEAHIDLHGLNSEQAYRALVDFLRVSYFKGVRTGLIVTGRGKNSLGGVSILRQKVQEWLVQEPFRRVVLAFCTARREDGGAGALYVLLRKRRKNSGKVRWDALPVDPDLF